MFNCFAPSIYANLSDVKTSVVPSDLINEYLSSSNGKKVSLVPAITFVDSWLLVIDIVSDFLTVMNESSKDTAETCCFGKTVYSVLSLDDSNLVSRIFRSVTWIWDESGSLPLTIPDTVVTPVIVTDDVPTLTTLANTGSIKSALLYLIRFPTFATFPGKSSLVETTVLIPEELTVVIVAIPMLNLVDGITSPVNVVPTPTIP